MYRSSAMVRRWSERISTCSAEMFCVMCFVVLRFRLCSLEFGSPLLSNCKFVFGLVRSCLPSGSVCLACLAFAPPRPSMNPCASEWWSWEVVASSNTPLARFHTLLMNFLCHTSLLLGLFVFGSFLKLRAFYDAVRDPTSALRSAPVGPRAPVRQFVHQPLLPPFGAPGMCGFVLPFG